MKNQLLVIAVLIIISMGLSNRGDAQSGPLSFQNNYVSSDTLTNSYAWCSVPQTVTFHVYGIHYGPGVTYPDTIQFTTQFGDGSDTTFQYISMGSTFYPSFPHTYTAAGSYSIECIALSNNGDGDTLTSYNQVIISDSCGNISGKVYIDANADCIYQTGETLMSFVPVQLLNGTTLIAWAYTDSVGEYHFDVPVGPTYTIHINNYYWSYSWNSICPSSGSITTPAPSSGNDFAIDCASGFDLTGYVYGAGFVPGQNHYHWLDAYNLRCTPTSGTVTLTLDPLVSFVSSVPSPASVSGNTLTWNFSNLTNGFYYYWWNSFWASVRLHTSSSAVIGDTVCLTMVVSPLTGDANDTNNTITFCRPVVSSYDPNEKDVAPRGTGTTGDILADSQHPMQYVVHFQNTGTYQAYNIFVLDPLDPDLDINTFQVVSTSHKMDVDILNGNVIKFSFNNIMLPDSGTDQRASNGYVSYTIKQKQGLTVGTELRNKASIYFDFNQPVVTNTTLNTIVAPSGISQNVSGNDVTVYPNPSNSIVTVEMNNAGFRMQNLVITDILGNTVSAYRQHLVNNKIQITGLASGVYFLRMNVNGNEINKKVVVAK